MIFQVKQTKYSGKSSEYFLVSFISNDNYDCLNVFVVIDYFNLAFMSDIFN